MFTASPFKLNTFTQCPRLYKYVYVDGLSAQYKKSKPYLTMGAHVHNALKDFYEKLLPAERNFAALEKLLRARWRENRRGFKDKQDEAQWGVKALQMLRLFTHRTDTKVNPVLLEDYYDVLVNPQLKLLGRVDRADEQENGTLHVIDYKTGKFDAAEVNDLQLMLYSMIISAHSKKPVTKASYLFLQTFTWHTIEVNQDQAEEALAQVQELVEKVQGEKEFAPTPNKYCRHCDFAEICPTRGSNPFLE